MATDHGQQSRIFGRGVSTKRHKASQGVRGCKKNGQKSVTYFVNSLIKS